MTPNNLALLIISTALGLLFLSNFDIRANEYDSNPRHHLAELARTHSDEIASLSAETIHLQEIISQQDQEIHHLTFMVGHATLQLQQTVGGPPDYDFKRFLRRNPGARKYFPYLLDAAAKYRHIWPVDPVFALAILKQESDFGRYVVSKAGALGDAQFIESTARRYRLNVHEPWNWKNGRANYRRAAEIRRAARGDRNRFIAAMEKAIDGSDSRSDGIERLTQSFPKQVWRLERYYSQMADAEKAQQRGDDEYESYKSYIKGAQSDARLIEKRLRERHLREVKLIRTSGLRADKTDAEHDIELRLAVNDHLAQIDPRLSPILLVDALVHHLADLFVEFKGDGRLVASRYNASRRAMEAAVARAGGGVGIPLLDETQNYVNKVTVFHAFLAMDAAIRPRELGFSCCAHLAAAPR